MTLGIVKGGAQVAQPIARPIGFAPPVLIVPTINRPKSGA